MKSFRTAFILVAGIILPLLSHAQDSGLSGDIGALQTTLNNVYNTMIVHASELIGIGRALAGFAATWFIAVRLWSNIARAEAVDVYSLLRPFALGIAITLYPGVISVMNGVLQPTVAGTAALVTDSDQAVATLLKQKEDALKQSNEWQEFIGPEGGGDLQKWEQLSGDADSGFLSGVSNRVKFEMAKFSYNFKNKIKVWMSEILQVLFQAAALCINTVRTFYLIILAILGPIVLGLSVFDGFHHVLLSWLAKYINVFLWLPIANIFGSLINQIQQEMVKLDIAQIQTTGQTTFGSTDTAYLVFLLMAILGYFTVPLVSNYIINSHSMGSGIGGVGRRAAGLVTAGVKQIVS